MMSGFALLTVVTAAISSLFVREEELPDLAEEDLVQEQVFAALGELSDRLRDIETRLPPFRNIDLNQTGV